MYGCIDTASRKVIWLRIWTDNCDPKRIADGILITSLRIAPARLKIIKILELAILQLCILSSDVAMVTLQIVPEVLY